MTKTFLLQKAYVAIPSQKILVASTQSSVLSNEAHKKAQDIESSDDTDPSMDLGADTRIIQSEEDHFKGKGRSIIEYWNYLNHKNFEDFIFI